MQVKEKVKEFIVNNFLMGAESAQLNDGDSFLEQGILDSTGILELVEFIQDSFAIKVADEELVPDNLDSLNNIDVFIRKKMDTDKETIDSNRI
ncbi:MAG: acyl carrier protein [Candidatus Omnitrophica bacterium]|nr:acyl carrier protein [Candidatus Omnitrophota bacterium]